MKPTNPLARLFGRSPFKPLVSHMDRVWNCVEKLKELLQAFSEGRHDDVARLADEISTTEHEADLTKNDIRNSLPKWTFLPVDRATLLEILALQDSIADEAEDVGVVLQYKKLEFVEDFRGDFQALAEKTIEAVSIAHNIISEMDNLLESSFGGAEAEKIKKMVDQVAYCEHETDLIQRRLLSRLFEKEKDLSYGEFFLWMRLFNETGSLADVSEKLANRVRMTLENH